MKDQKKAEQIAAERVQLLAPLLEEGLDPAKAKEIKARICEQTGISERTLRRYLATYRHEGFGGLKPKSKGKQPSRFVLHGEFYPVMDKTIVEDCFRRSIQKYGVPEAVYFDNGKQYRTKWMTRACSKLGVRLLFAKPYSPEATGKVERFNRVVDSFLSEAALEKPKTLERLNELFQVWLTECYQNKPHSALENKRSPETVFRSDKKALRFVEPESLAHAFLHCESRKVDKSGCISFMDRKYEVGLPFIGCTVDVVYDPADITELSIEYEGHDPWKVKELVIGERAGKRPPLPNHLQPQQADSSRLLSAAEERSQKRHMEQAPAVTYRRVSKGNGHV